MFNIQNEITEYKTALQIYFLDKMRIYQNLLEKGLTSEDALKDIQLIQSYISSVFQVLSELNIDINNYQTEFLAINNTRRIINEEKEKSQQAVDKKLLSLDDQRLIKTFNAEIRKVRSELFKKFKACLTMAKEALKNSDMLDTKILVGSKAISISEILNRIEFVGENINPLLDDSKKIDYIVDGSIMQKLKTIKAYEESDDIKIQDRVTFFARLFGESPKTIVTGKSELLKMASSKQKISACRDAIDRLDPIRYPKTREVLMNLITRYSNEYKLNDLLFKGTDYELIESSVKRTKEEKEREERINRYAGLYALYLEKLENDSEDIDEYEAYLSEYDLTPDELITGRIYGSQLYSARKNNTKELPLDEYSDASGSRK